VHPSSGKTKAVAIENIPYMGAFGCDPSDFVTEQTFYHKTKKIKRWIYRALIFVFFGLISYLLS